MEIQLLGGVLHTLITARVTAGPHGIAMSSIVMAMGAPFVLESSGVIEDQFRTEQNIPILSAEINQRVAYAESPTMGGRSSSGYQA